MNNIDIIHIVARSTNNIIGVDNDIPWKLPSDLKFFKENTLDHVCIVGRKTYDGIKHLKGREFIVLSRGKERVENNVIFTNDIDRAICLASVKATINKQDKVFIIGGAEIYKKTFDHATKLLVTEVYMNVEGNAEYIIPDNFVLVHEWAIQKENDIYYQFTEYKKDLNIL